MYKVSFYSIDQPSAMNSFSLGSNKPFIAESSNDVPLIALADKAYLYLFNATDLSLGVQSININSIDVS